MNDERNMHQGKSVGDLGLEAVRFLLHTLAAAASVVLIMLGGALLHVDADAAGPKEIATFLTFLLALFAGFAVARMRRDPVARNVWISAVVFFAIVSVWVLDLPTQSGLCEHCGALEKLTRTFFSLRNGSGLISGWGLVLGSWVPLAMIGYAVGAHLAMGRATTTPVR